MAGGIVLQGVRETQLIFGRGHRANEKEIEYFITRQVSTEETQEYYVNALTVFNIIESLKSGKPIPVEDIR